jgi:hypothetical protein
MLTVQLTDADYLAAQRLHTRRARMIPWLLDGALIALGALASAGVFGREFAKGGGPFAVAMTIILLLTVIAQYAIAPRRWLRNFREQKSAQHPITYSWSDTALSTQGDYGNSTVPWTDFLKIRENEQTYLLYLAKMLFYCIPKRAFATAEGAAEFGALVKARIGRSG